MIRVKGQKKWGIKSYTKYQILRLLRDRGRLSSSEIAEALGLSRSTVYTLMGYYRSMNLVRVDGWRIKEGRGRNARLWELTGRGLKDIERLEEIYGF